MIYLKKQKSKVILKKENTYSSNCFANRLKRKAFASKDFMDEFWEGPYFNQPYFRGPWTWLCSVGMASISSFSVLPIAVPVMRYIQDTLDMDTVSVVIPSVCFIIFVLTIIWQLLATWFRRKYDL